VAETLTSRRYNGLRKEGQAEETGESPSEIG